jgi:hypothetical protein
MYLVLQISILKGACQFIYVYVLSFSHARYTSSNDELILSLKYSYFTQERENLMHLGGLRGPVLSYPAHCRLLSFDFRTWRVSFPATHIHTHMHMHTYAFCKYVKGKTANSP